MATRAQAVTAEDLLAMSDDGVRRELVRGEVREMTPSSHEHGDIALEIGMRLRMHVKRNGLGKAYAAETGFRIGTDPDSVRAPDCAFVRAERIAEGEGHTFFPGSPDLAIEVVSPGDRYTEVEEKVFDWLEAGTRMVIVVNPRERSATVYRSKRDIVVLDGDDEIEGGDVVPGCTVPVRELFA